MKILSILIIIGIYIWVASVTSGTLDALVLTIVVTGVLSLTPLGVLIVVPWLDKKK